MELIKWLNQQNTTLVFESSNMAGPWKAVEGPYIMLSDCQPSASRPDMNEEADRIAANRFSKMLIAADEERGDKAAEAFPRYHRLGHRRL